MGLGLSKEIRKAQKQMLKTQFSESFEDKNTITLEQFLYSLLDKKELGYITTAKITDTLCNFEKSRLSELDNELDEDKMMESKQAVIKLSILSRQYILDGMMNDTIIMKDGNPIEKFDSETKSKTIAKRKEIFRSIISNSDITPEIKIKFCTLLLKTQTNINLRAYIIEGQSFIEKKNKIPISHEKNKIDTLTKKTLHKFTSYVLADTPYSNNSKKITNDFISFVNKISPKKEPEYDVIEEIGRIFQERFEKLTVIVAT